MVRRNLLGIQEEVIRLDFDTLYIDRSADFGAAGRFLLNIFKTFGSLKFYIYFCSMEVKEVSIISLSDLKKGLPGISPVEGANLYENCIVRLHKNGISSDTILKVDGLKSCEFSLLWDEEINGQLERTYADEQSLTERSAVGVSVLLALKLTDYTVIEKSRKGTGFDYMLGLKDDILFTPKARLEISGINKETQDNSVISRYNSKIKQTDKSDDSGLPAYISVVEFSMPKALFGLKLD